jgi:hypothetical protein
MHQHPRYINVQNNNLQEFISNFVPIICHFCGFGLFLSTPLLICCLLLMQLLRDDDNADDARAPGPPSPTTHQTAYIPNSINEEIHHVQHWSSESVLRLTTFGVLGIHAQQQHNGPPSLIRRP